jgi:hypothetical protein
MTRSIIYTVDAQNRLTAMSPAAPESEDMMQRLVADYPEIIAEGDEALLLVKREQEIADGDLSSRWSLDHLFVTRAGVPVLVELKRASDTRLRREVVGQMLDYAANATAHWQAGTIAASFAGTATEMGRDPDALLADFLPEGIAPDAFWEKVDDNFALGQIKLVFVADTIPRELARIVEFLNEQMRADVRAVELSWFEGSGVRAFTPRVIGDTQRAQAAKPGAPPPPVTRDAWIARDLAPLGPDAVAAAGVFIAAVEAAGGIAEVSTAQASLVAVFPAPPRTIYPLFLRRSGGGIVVLALKYLRATPAYAAAAARQELCDRLARILGERTTGSVDGFPTFPAARLTAEGVPEALAALLRDIAAARD